MGINNKYILYEVKSSVPIHTYFYIIHLYYIIFIFTAADDQHGEWSVTRIRPKCRLDNAAICMMRLWRAWSHVCLCVPGHVSSQHADHNERGQIQQGVQNMQKIIFPIVHYMFKCSTKLCEYCKMTFYIIWKDMKAPNEPAGLMIPGKYLIPNHNRYNIALKNNHLHGSCKSHHLRNIWYLIFMIVNVICSWYIYFQMFLPSILQEETSAMQFRLYSTKQTYFFA